VKKTFDVPVQILTTVRVVGVESEDVARFHAKAYTHPRVTMPEGAEIELSVLEESPQTHTNYALGPVVEVIPDPDEGRRMNVQELDEHIPKGVTCTPYPHTSKGAQT
jgi:hypothetical protein